MLSSLIVEDFFINPDQIREFAISQKFDIKQFNFPGRRTLPLDEINPEFSDEFNKKILDLIFKEDSRPDTRIYSAFQYVSYNYEYGWIHLDHQVDFAGVVYLSPDSLTTAGTSIYRLINEYDASRDTWVVRDSFYDDNCTVPLEEYRTIRDKHNRHYEQTLAVKNIFNRLLIYRGNQYHKEDGFFGTCKEDSRLTLVFFLQIKK